MKTLEQHNHERALMYDELLGNRPVKNGIACPNCGAELLDSNPSMQLCSNPPQTYVHCAAEGCDYVGYRVV